jgi:DNA-binding response OmpR family regulator
MTSVLSGRRLLVVEDEYFLAADLAQALSADGAEVIGPVADVDGALDLLDDTDQLDGAVLDLNLQGEMAFPVADALMERRIPFLFSTGYDQSAIPPRFADAPRCEKPVKVTAIAKALFG